MAFYYAWMEYRNEILQQHIGVERCLFKEGVLQKVATIGVLRLPGFYPVVVGPFVGQLLEGLVGLLGKNIIIF